MLNIFTICKVSSENKNKLSSTVKKIKKFKNFRGHYPCVRFFFHVCSWTKPPKKEIWHDFRTFFQLNYSKLWSLNSFDKIELFLKNTKFKLHHDLRIEFKKWVQAKLGKVRIYGQTDDIFDCLRVGMKFLTAAELLF